MRRPFRSAADRARRSAVPRAALAALAALVLVAGCSTGGSRPAGLDLPPVSQPKGAPVIDPLGRVLLTPADRAAGLQPLPERISTAALGTKAFMEAVFRSVEDYWTTQLAKLHRKPPEVRFTVLEHGQSLRSACLPRSLPKGTEDLLAFFCPLDNRIVVSEQLAEDVLKGTISAPDFGTRRTRNSGDLAVAYVIAHEYGHAVQYDLGLFGRNSDSSPRIEQHADCLAGVWAHEAITDHLLEDANLGEAVAAAGLVGDYETSSPGHHGTPRERVAALLLGYAGARPSSCQPLLGRH